MQTLLSSSFFRWCSIFLFPLASVFFILSCSKPFVGQAQIVFNPQLIKKQYDLAIQKDVSPQNIFFAQCLYCPDDQWPPYNIALFKKSVMGRWFWTLVLYHYNISTHKIDLIEQQQLPGTSNIQSVLIQKQTLIDHYPQLVIHLFSPNRQYVYIENFLTTVINSTKTLQLKLVFWRTTPGLIHMSRNCKNKTCPMQMSLTQDSIHQNTLVHQIKTYAWTPSQNSYQLILTSLQTHTLDATERFLYKLHTNGLKNILEGLWNTTKNGSDTHLLFHFTSHSGSMTLFNQHHSDSYILKSVRKSLYNTLSFVLQPLPGSKEQANIMDVTLLSTNKILLTMNQANTGVSDRSTFTADDEKHPSPKMLSSPSGSLSLKGQYRGPHGLWQFSDSQVMSPENTKWQNYYIYKQGQDIYLQIGIDHSQMFELQKQYLSWILIPITQFDTSFLLKQSKKQFHLYRIS